MIERSIGPMLDRYPGVLLELVRGVELLLAVRLRRERDLRQEECEGRDQGERALHECASPPKYVTSESASSIV